MSCSSCSRMWQCQTYSFPPVRGLGGTVNGTVGRLNCAMIVVTSLGFMRTVSFHPISLGSGANGFPTNVIPVDGSPVNDCRWMIWTLTRWKWIGWVSPVRLKSCQTSVAPAVGVSVAADSYDRPNVVTPWLLLPILTEVPSV